MKKTPYLLAIICLLFSCKKNDKVNTDEIRILKVQGHDNTTNVYNNTYEYDAQGRITRISYFENNATPKTLATITYNGTEALIVNTPESNAAVNTSDSIWITLDVERKPLKRIEHQFFEFFPPANQAQRSYISDTSIYTYDGVGLLSRIDNKRLDTTWSAGNGVSADRSTGTTNYTVSGGNITASSRNIALSFWSKQNGIVYTSSQTRATSLAYSFTKNYSNKMDFANVAILQEYFAFFNYPMSKHSANLPEKVTETEVDRDQNGVIYYSGSSHIDLVLAYNRYGFLSSLITDPSKPAFRTEYFYSK